MTIGPYYFNGTAFPTQAGKPVTLSLLQFHNCCCPDNCLLIAYNEHRIVLGQAAVESATEAEMQTWMEDHCTSFIDHVSGPLTPDSTAFLFFTQAAWYAAAGIDGSWLPGDTAKAFAALKWTLLAAPMTVEASDPYLTKGTDYQYFSSFAAAKSAAILAWQDAEWVPSEVYVEDVIGWASIFLTRSTDLNGEARWVAAAWANTNKAVVYGIPTEIPVTIDFYGMCRSDAPDFPWFPPPDLAWTENQLKLFSTVGPSQTPTVESGYVLPLDIAAPIRDLSDPEWPPDTHEQWVVWCWGNNAGAPSIVFKWAFTECI